MYELQLEFNRTVTSLVFFLSFGYRVSPRTVLTSPITASFNFEPNVFLEHPTPNSNLRNNR